MPQRIEIFRIGPQVGVVMNGPHRNIDNRIGRNSDSFDDCRFLAFARNKSVETFKNISKAEWNSIVDDTLTKAAEGTFEAIR